MPKNLLEHFDTCIYKLCKLRVSFTYFLEQQKAPQKPQPLELPGGTALQKNSRVFHFFVKIFFTLLAKGKNLNFKLRDTAYRFKHWQSIVTASHEEHI